MRENVPPLAKHLGGVALLSWQDKKRVDMISKYCKDEICVAVLWLFAITMLTWEWWI
jgi:hypothetical protein